MQGLLLGFVGVQALNVFTDRSAATDVCCQTVSPLSSRVPSPHISLLFGGTARRQEEKLSVLIKRSSLFRRNDEHFPENGSSEVGQYLSILFESSIMS